MGGGGGLFLGLVLFNETVNNAALFLNHKVFKVEPTNTENTNTFPEKVSTLSIKCLILFPDLYLDGEHNRENCSEILCGSVFNVPSSSMFCCLEL